MNGESEPVAFNEYSKEQWREIAKRLRPEWSDDDFEAAWNEFCELSQRVVMH